MMTIKLEAPRTFLYARIKKKRKGDQGGEWLKRYPLNFDMDGWT